MANPNFDTILATTLNNHMPKLVDNVFSARPLVFFLKEAGQIRPVGGGAKIVVPLIHGMNSTAGSYAGYDTIATTAQTGISASEWNWKQFAATISINGLEEAQNSSVEQVIDLLEAKIMQTEETILEKLDEDFFQDGTGNSGKDFNGLAKLITAHPNDVTIGGINPTTNAYWASYRRAAAGPLTIAGMTTDFNTVTVGNDKPNVILTTQALFEKYEALLQPAQRFTDSSTADAGFQNLTFKGVPITYDTYCQSGTMYFVNTKYLRLVGHKDNWFKATPFVRPENQDARYAQILLYGELTVSNRKRQGSVTGLT
jgi:hypothetical protein